MEKLDKKTVDTVTAGLEPMLAELDDHIRQVTPAGGSAHWERAAELTTNLRRHIKALRENK